eukprot:3427932-Alexandrium_andersonii.AAC.1
MQKRLELYQLHTYTSQQMLNAVLFSRELRADSSMLPTLRCALQMALPSDMCEAAFSFIQDAARIAPSPGTLSWARFAVDCSYNIVFRERRLQDALASGRRGAASIMVDSSPQFGRDYELGLVSLVLPDGLQRAFDLLA